MRNNKGFTLVEVMLAVVLAGIITSAIGFFMVANIQSYQTTKSLTDLQYNGQSTMNQLEDILIHSEGIREIGNGTSGAGLSIYNTVSVANPLNLAIKSRDDKYLYFEYDSGNKIINMYEGTSVAAITSTKVEFARNVAFFSMKAIPTGRNFMTCEGVEYEITLDASDFDLKMSKEVKFRNK